MNADLTQFFELSVQEARKSTAEDGRIHPKVGVVVVRDGKVLGSAHRGEIEPGEHAEYTVLEKKLPTEVLAGSTVFATLEPCTDRNPPKAPCVQHLINRKVKQVYIGMLDPNPVITGRGQLALRSAGIETEFYPAVFMSQLEELNRAFIKDQQNSRPKLHIDPSFVERNRTRPLDQWYKSINSIYWNRNFQRDTSSVFTHLVEVVGAMSLLASDKGKAGVDPATYIPKALAWWMALCGKVGVKSVEDMLWDKFPGVCAYCHKCPHDSEECTELKRLYSGPRWEALASIAKQGKERPKSLGDWQRVFSAIYPAQQTEGYGAPFARLCEELGELAEAIRVFSSRPGYFLSEACDVFAWLMHVQNLIELKQGVPKAMRGQAIEQAFCTNYPDLCLDCGRGRCACPPILSSTVGRIAHEVPQGRGAFNELGRFMTPDRASQLFAG